MSTPSHQEGYMRRIGFLDGQILHDHHLNTMQRNIAQSLKIRLTEEKYDMRLLVSPYNYYFAEPFVDNRHRSESSTASFDDLDFCIRSGTWISDLIQLPEYTDQFYLLSKYYDYPSEGSVVNFYYRTSNEGDWIQITTDEAVHLPSERRYLQIRIDCLYQNSQRPEVFDYAVMVR